MLKALNSNNPNAALTVFRHFDSGSVAYGLVGNNPETAWVIDYPLLERIHYLLVAGFNVYGNIVHQVNTRVYMDFLRMEGEDHFLAFLPTSERETIRNSWYKGLRSNVQKYFRAPDGWLKVESVSGYQSKHPQQELYTYIKQRLSHLSQHSEDANRCGSPCKPVSTLDANTLKKVNTAMEKIANMKGEKLYSLSDVSFIRITSRETKKRLAYTLIRNKAYKTVSSFLDDERDRGREDIKQDTMTVVNWLEGSYPNFFFSVDLSEIDQFADSCSSIKNQSDYEKFVHQYGVRRTDPEFWKVADWFQRQSIKERPIRSGLFDLNRYHNH